MSAQYRTTRRIVLSPRAGARFQPTGFPDLGAAEFDAPDGNGKWVPALHVESPQSMANRMELTTWDSAGQRQVSALDGVPYVEVRTPDGEFKTSSRVEAHRLAAAYVLDAHTADGEEGRKWLETRLGIKKGSAIDYPALASAVFDLDPLSLLHGVFFAQKAWPWQPKIARAVTAFIDADDVRRAVSGGVKTDYADPSGGATDSGYGMVPHSRTEYTAQRITAFLTVDHEQLRGYGLGDAKTELLEALVDFEIASLFAGGLRLRTACDLVVAEGQGDDLPDIESATARARSAIAACEGQLGPVTTLIFTDKQRKK